MKDDDSADGWFAGSITGCTQDVRSLLPNCSFAFSVSSLPCLYHSGPRTAGITARGGQASQTRSRRWEEAQLVRRRSMAL